LCRLRGTESDAAMRACVEECRRLFRSSVEGRLDGLLGLWLLRFIPWRRRFLPLLLLGTLVEQRTVLLCAVASASPLTSRLPRRCGRIRAPPGL